MYELTIVNQTNLSTMTNSNYGKSWVKTKNSYIILNLFSDKKDIHNILLSDDLTIYGNGLYLKPTSPQGER